MLVIKRCKQFIYKCSMFGNEVFFFIIFYFILIYKRDGEVMRRQCYVW